MFELLSEMRGERDAALSRAEKAEAEAASLRAELATLRAELSALRLELEKVKAEKDRLFDADWKAALADAAAEKERT